MNSTKTNFNITICDNLFKHGLGLTFRFPKKPFAYIFVFKKPVKLAITMWFVFYPIDIVFLDKDGFVVEFIRGLKPFKNYFPKNHFTYFVEFPIDSLSKLDVKIGSNLKWSSDSITITNN